MGICSSAHDPSACLREAEAASLRRRQVRYAYTKALLAAKRPKRPPSFAGEEALEHDRHPARHRAFQQRAHRLGRLVEPEGAVDMRPAEPGFAPAADALHQGEGAVSLLEARVVWAPADIVAVVEAGH